MKKAKTKTRPLASLDFPVSELVFALVYPVGTNDRPVIANIRDQLGKFEYKTNEIRLSHYLSSVVKKLALDVKLRKKPEYLRIETHMDAGNRACKESGRSDFMALRACAQISSERKTTAGGKPVPASKKAHVLVSLKRPEEVVALRRIYGSGFFLIGIFATEEERLDFLTKDKNIPIKHAEEIIKRDDTEDDNFGQRTRDTFHMADAFVGLSDQKKCKEQLWRFLDLVFNRPYETPTRDENAMFLAYAAAARSASPSRQVGATICSSSGEIIAIGCNEVPKAKGGLYWPDGGPDERDHRFNYNGKIIVDSNTACRDEIVEEIVEKLLPDVSREERLAKGKEMLKGSSLFNISEYGRAVHAEMEAILSCTRSGVSPKGGTLYTTTFPCHNCTRHIIASGIERVVYIEPYSKSKAKDLHYDSITLLGEGGGGTPAKPAKERVRFEPFVGVGPRRYFDFFSLGLSSGHAKRRRAEDGKITHFDPASAHVRVPMLPTSYLDRERLAVKEIEETLRKLEK